MKTAWEKRAVCNLLIASAIFCLSGPAVRAQQSPVKKDKEVEKKELEVETAKVELEKKKLELEKAKKDLQAQETVGRLTMRLQGDVLFDYGKSELRPEAKTALEKVAVVLSQFPESNILIRGYTDAKGPPDANLALSEKRAAAVKRWMVNEKAISEAKITTEGLGEKDPVAPNKKPDDSDNPEGRQQNRRVEITVEKLPYSQ